MIRDFKLFASKGTLQIALLEYGYAPVAIDAVDMAVKMLGLEEYNRDTVESALNAGKFAVMEASVMAPSNLGGTCWVEHKDSDKSVIAHVHPPQGTGVTIGESDIYTEISRAGYSEYYKFTDIIRRNVDMAKSTHSPTSFKAAECRDAEIRVEIDEPKRNAFITFMKARGGTTPTFEETMEILASQGVKFGIDEDCVRSIIENNVDISRQQIAAALEPVRGENARLEYFFDVIHEHTGPRIHENDRADFRDLNLFQNVEAGSPVARKIPATSGTEGMDVSGKPLKAEPGADVQIPKGKNTEISKDDPNVLIAVTSGAPKVVGGKITIQDVLILDNIDFSTGNVRFNGNIIVKGIVNSGFELRASGNITCNDVVEGANIFAGGSIFMKRGVKGQGKSIIEAGRNVIARFIERCTVKAGQSVLVEEALIHSITMAVDTVAANHSKGKIIGGHIRAGNLVAAGTIGSEMATKTEIEVGLSHYIKEVLATLNTEFTKKNEQYAAASEKLSLLVASKHRSGFTVVKQERYESLSAIVSQLKDELDELSSRIAELENELNASKNGRVEAHQVIHPGVLITIANSRLRISESIHNAIYIKEGHEVVLATEVNIRG